tara:strand:- start:8530 stop:9453 length:924 start_codon:yes stop_codon:yes gene_type:complete
MKLEKGTVTVNFTIGFGNNIFQYVFARTLAEKNNMVLNHRGLPQLSIAPEHNKPNRNLKTILVDDNNYKKILFRDDVCNHNVVINGYFEDYKIIKKNLDVIREWFPKVKKTNTKDVVLHLRLQNRLIQESHNKNHISAESYKSVIEQFDYERLHIVTDAEKWAKYSMEGIEKIRREISIGPNPPSNSPWSPVEQSLEYINHLITGLDDLNPIVHCNGAATIPNSGGLRDDFMTDFNFIRQFEQVVVHNSTFSWWAATLSGAKRVAIFNPWKIAKSPEYRRNLGQTDFHGWFNWGSSDDLYFKHYGVK